MSSLFVAALVALLGAGPAAAGAPCLSAPVTAPVVDRFRLPGCRWCPGNRGLEYRTAPGTPVRAAGPGVVSFAGPVAGVRYVVVEHPGGLRTTYGRLDAVLVAVGSPVAVGTVVGSAGPALFFGLRRGEHYLDPAAYLTEWRVSPRLVPTGGGSRRPATRGGFTCVASRRAR